MSNSTSRLLRYFAIAVLALIPVSVIATLGSHANQNDFVEYWAAGKLFAERANPYSGTMILAIEKSRGFSPADPLIMLNPPWIMPLVAPLGFLPAIPALVLWIVACAGCIAAAVALLQLPANNRGLAFLFAPVLGSFMMEQSSPFLLLGLALFLRLERTRPFLAGASLALMAIKPHLFLVFWVALAGDCLYRRRWTVAAGFAASLATVSGLVTLVVPSIWRNYLEVVRSSTLEKNAYPTLPSLLRATIDVQLVWIALVPSFLAVLWGAAYFWKRRKVWNWRIQGMPVLLVTVLTSPYSWISDQVVLLPPVAAALDPASDPASDPALDPALDPASDPASNAAPRRFSMEILIAINCAALIWLNISFRSMVWLPLALTLWFLYATLKGERRIVAGTANGAT